MTLVRRSPRLEELPKNTASRLRAGVFRPLPFLVASLGLLPVVACSSSDDNTNDDVGLDGAAGRDGKDGVSCELKDNNGTVTITCGDASATLRDGKDGEDGDDGRDGEDGDDGQDGKDGEDGAAASCSITDNGDRTRTISCSDGTSVTVDEAGSALDGCTSGTERFHAATVLTLDCPDGDFKSVGYAVPQRPVDLRPQLAGGRGFSCALPSDGPALCWGLDDEEQASPPQDFSFVQIALGHHHGCGLDPEGTPACWGVNTSGEGSPPSGAFVQLTAAYEYSCGLRSSGEVECWGNVEDGQNAPPDDVRFVHISASGGQDAALWPGRVCGIDLEGAVHCWGSDGYDALHGAPAGQYVQLSGGIQHSCGLAVGGGAHCWGRTEALRTEAQAGAFRSITSNGTYNCGLRRNGAAHCWGDDTGEEYTLPIEGTFVQLAAGYHHACGLRENGDLQCWGSDAENQLSDAPGTVF